MSSTRHPGNSIRVRYALIIGVATIAFGVILAGVVGQMARAQIEKDQGMALQATARRIMDTLDQGMFERYREVQILAGLSDVRDPAVSVEQKRSLLEKVQGTHGHLAWIGIAGMDGMAHVGTHGYLEGRDVSKRPWFKNGLAGPYAGDVHDALLLAKLLPNPSGEMIYLLDVAAPITGLDGQPSGVICSHLHWRWTKDALQGVLASKSNIEAFLLTRDGLILTGPGHKIFDPFEGSAPTVEKALRDTPSAYYLANWKGKRSYLTTHVVSQGFRDYPGLGWRLVLRQDSETAFATANELQQRIQWIGVGIGLLFATLAWFLSGRLTRPIEELTEAAEGLGEMKLDTRLPRFSGKDEIARLSTALNHMVDNLKGEIFTRRAAEERLQLAATVFENSAEGIVITDAQNTIVTINAAFTKITGYEAADVIGRNPRILNSGRNSQSFYEKMWGALTKKGTWQGEVWNRKKNGELYPEWLVINTVMDDAGAVKHYVAVFTDITERKQAEERIRFLANHDGLTDLPNRHLLADRLEHALGRARRMGTRLAVLHLNLDRFKDINDTLGYGAGDELLKAVATRLQMALRSGDTVARQGGDEFIAVVEDIRESSDMAPILESVLDSLAEPLSLSGGTLLSITPSIGIAFYPEDGETMDSLVKHAGMAMSRAKEVGRNNYQFYVPALNEHIVRRLDMETRLRRALEEERFELHYQPQVEIASGRIVGAEALLRLTDPEVGNISPAEFIPLAEETGLILPLGDWVLQTAIRQAADWAAKGKPVRVAVNISAKQLKRRDLAAFVGELLAQTGLKPRLLEIELTESVLMMAGETERGNIEQLTRLGMDLSLDDFGTGYSSLSYLRRLNVSALKIDRSFVQDIDHTEGALLTQAIISMARNLKLKTVAEGVETPEQLAFLTEYGVDIYQGFLFGKAMPASEFEGRLNS